MRGAASADAENTEINRGVEARQTAIINPLSVTFATRFIMSKLPSRGLLISTVEPLEVMQMERERGLGIRN